MLASHLLDSQGMRSTRPGWLLALALTAACGVPDFGFTPAPADQDASDGAGGAGGAASGGSAGTGGGVSGAGGASGGASPCGSDADCKDPTPRCELGTSKCVKCLPSNDTCPLGQYCATTNVCLAGCKTTAECNDFDGGTGGLVCEAHQCKCTKDADCESGKLCSPTTGQCVAGCTTEHPCATGYACCAGSCFNLAFDVKHCGACDTACPPNPPNAKPQCAAGKCGLECNFKMKDCNSNPADGCEVDVFADPKNCGFCGTVCPAGQACNNKVCG